MAAQLREIPDHFLKTERFIALDGIPASGKTTTLRELSVLAGGKFHGVDEPVRSWQNFEIGGHNIDLLREYYINPSQLNTNILQFYISMTLKDQSKEIDALLVKDRELRVITDRSIRSNAPFIAAFQDLEILDRTYSEAQLAVARIFEASAQFKPTTIYFQVPPETALKRIQNRGRRGEDKITLSYLETLSEKTEKAISPKDYVLSHIPAEDAKQVAEVIFRKCF